MQILDYFRKLKTNFDLKNIKSEIDSVRDELVNQTLPTVTEAAKSITQNPALFKSETYKLYFDAMNAIQPIPRNAHVLDVLVGRLNKAKGLLDHLASTVENEFSEHINAETITLKGSYVFRLINLIELYSRYSIRLSETILIAENNLQNDRLDLDGIAPLSLAFLSKNKESFLECHRILNIEPDQIAEQLSNVPDVVLSEVRSPSMLTMHGKSTIDPFRMGFAESKADIFWLWAVNRAEYQANRYNVLKEDCRLLELLIERRKRALKADGSDFALQKIIAKREAELDIKRAKIAKIEKIYDR